MTASPLWTPASPHDTEIEKLREKVNTLHSVQLKDYAELHKWSVENPELFWETIWKENNVIASEPYTQVVDD
jgi:acetoacetyl-CoA synthetase